MTQCPNCSYYKVTSFSQKITTRQWIPLKFEDWSEGQKRYKATIARIAIGFWMFALLLLPFTFLSSAGNPVGVMILAGIGILFLSWSLIIETKKEYFEQMKLGSTKETIIGTHYDHLCQNCGYSWTSEN